MTDAGHAARATAATWPCVRKFVSIGFRNTFAADSDALTGLRMGLEFQW